MDHDGGLVRRRSSAGPREWLAVQAEASRGTMNYLPLGLRHLQTPGLEKEHRSPGLGTGQLTLVGTRDEFANVPKCNGCWPTVRGGVYAQQCSCDFPHCAGSGDQAPKYGIICTENDPMATGIVCGEIGDWNSMR